MSIVLESYERDFEKFLVTSNKLMNSFHLTDEGSLFSEKKLIFSFILSQKRNDSPTNKKEFNRCRGKCLFYIF